MVKRKICIATGTRAEWGLLSGIAQELSLRDDVELQIIATNMHLSPRYGMTVNEIIADGFNVDAKVHMLDDYADDTPRDTVQSMSRGLSGFANAFSTLQPDIVVILGDRYEMLAVASAALIFRIPIAHIAGGEISEGAYDDSIRHAITKMSSLHLTATEDNRQRVIQMGEHPDLVINTGAIGVYNIMHEKPIPKPDLEQSIGTTIPKGTLLVTYHPATLDDTPAETQIKSLLNALDAFPDNHVIITYPNSDTNGRIIIDLIEQYATKNKGRVLAISSLGKRRYLSALHYVAAVVGNSSSGIVEVPSMHIPTVNIGIRQRGRLASSSVIHCQNNTTDIINGITYALSDKGMANALHANNPYEKDDTLSLIVNAIATTPLNRLGIKQFYHLRP